MCVWLNILEFYKHSVNYKSNETIGLEDQAIVVDLLDAGLTQIVLTHFAYAVKPMNSLGGMSEYYERHSIKSLVDKVIQCYHPKIGPYLSRRAQVETCRINYDLYKKKFGIDKE